MDFDLSTKEDYSGDTINNERINQECNKLSADIDCILSVRMHI
jgi:hypothetical protein